MILVVIPRWGGPKFFIVETNWSMPSIECQSRREDQEVAEEIQGLDKEVHFSDFQGHLSRRDPRFRFIMPSEYRRGESGSHVDLRPRSHDRRHRFEEGSPQKRERSRKRGGSQKRSRSRDQVILRRRDRSAKHAPERESRDQRSSRLDEETRGEKDLSRRNSPRHRDDDRGNDRRRNRDAPGTRERDSGYDKEAGRDVRNGGRDGGKKRDAGRSPEGDRQLPQNVAPDPRFRNGVNVDAQVALRKKVPFFRRSSFS